MESREEITAKVKEVADIVRIISEHVDLRKSGTRYLGLCPFHSEKTPSFTVHPEKQFFYCFGCGASGDVFSFLMKLQNLSFPEALKQVAQRYNIQLPEKKVTAEQQKTLELKQQIFAVNKKSQSIYSAFLQESPDAEAARAYLRERKIPQDVQQQFGLGYAPSHQTAGWNFLGGRLGTDEKQAAIEAGLLVKKETGTTYDRFRDRIMFPIYDISGQVCGYGGRIVGDGQPKYMNSPECLAYNKSRSLLGLFQLKESIRKRGRAIIVEGNFDLISLVVHGCDNVVAPLGTALTREQLRLLRRFADEAVLLFDGDDAGINAALRAVPLFLAEQMRGKVALLPKGHDPDTFVQEAGLKALEELLENAQELSEFTLSMLIARHGLTLEGKTRIVEELPPIIRAAPSSLQRSVVIGHFAEKLNIPVEHLERQVGEQGGGFAEEPAVKQRQPRAAAPAIPMTPAQKRLVSFMVMQPEMFAELQEAGLREALEQSTGEILFLTLQALHQNHPEVQPEEILSQLPDSSERQIVADILLEAQGRDPGSETLAAEEEDCLSYLKKIQLQKQSKTLLQKIEEAQKNGDFGQLQDLLLKKQQIDQKIQTTR